RSRSRLIMALAVVLVTCALLPVRLLAQAAISGQVITPTGSPASGAKVRVCLSTSVGTPCSTSGVTLSYSTSMTPTISNPVTADSYGNYSFYTTPGQYIIQITPTAGVTYTYFYSGQGGAASVSSVGLALPGSTFSVTNSPVTTAGTLTGSFINQSANTFLAG